MVLKRAGFFFIHDKKEYGIFDENYKGLRTCRIYFIKTAAFREKISIKTIKSLIHDWVSKNYETNINQGLIDYVTEKAEETIEIQEVWVPIRFLHIQRPFVVGRVTFKTITKTFIDDIEALDKGLPR